MPDILVYASWDPKDVKKVRSADELAAAEGLGYIAVEKQAGEPTKAEAFARGAAQGATAGFADELGAGIDAQSRGSIGRYGMGPNVDGPAKDPMDPKAREAIRVQKRDEIRGANERARGAEPGMYKGGEFTGAVASSLAIPGGAMSTIPRAIGTGAALGAASGAGNAAEMKDVAGDALVGGAVGGVTGGGGAVVARGASAGLRSVFDKIAKRAAPAAVEAAKGADKMRLLTTEGATGGSIANPRILESVNGKLAGQPPVKGGEAEAARVMREYGMAPFVATTSGILSRAEQTTAWAQATKQSFLDAVEKAAPGGEVSRTAIAANLRANAAKLLDEADAFEPVALALQKQAAKYEAAAGTPMAPATGGGTMLPDGFRPMTMGRAANEANAVGSLVPKWGAAAPTKSMASQQQVRGIRSAADDYAEDVLGANGGVPAEVAEAFTKMGRPVPGTPRAAYQELRKVEQVARKAADAAERSLGRQGKNRLLGLGDLGVAETAATLGAGAGGVVVATAAKKAVSAVGASLRANRAEWGAAVLKALADPSLAARVGSAGDRLTQASARGPQALAAELWVLQRTDPEFARVADEVADQQTKAAPQRSLRDALGQR